MVKSPSTIVSTPRLSEVARHLVIPEGITTSVFPRVYRRLSEVGVSFDPWQLGFGTAALGCRADGRYAATIGGVVASIPRQVGKTFTVGNLVIGLCLEFPGSRWIWTSHHNRTTTNTFRAFQGMVTRKKVAPFLAPNGIRTANGEQEIRFANGSIIMFGAREQGFGRGLDEIDGEVFDEAQILTMKALEDMVPATNQARHPHGALVFFLGTPPRLTDPGEAFSAKRDRAINGKSTDQMYVELAAEADADPYDASIYPSFNPSFPHRTPMEAMQRMLENIPDEDSIRREMMGIWPVFGGGLISSEMWLSLTDKASEPTDPVSFGVYVNRDRTKTAIAVAGYRSDGLIHVAIVPAVHGQAQVDSLPGTGWIPDRVKELNEKWRPCATVIDSASAAASLITVIEEAGVEVETTTAGDMARACGNFFDAVVERKLRHQGTTPLAASVVAGKQRDLADSWAWDRKDRTSDITQLVAVTLALHGLIEKGHPAQSKYENDDLMVV